MLTKLSTSLLVTALSFGLASTPSAAVFRDSLEYGTNASMIGIGKVEGFTPHAGVVLENTAALTQSQHGLSLFYLNGMDNTVTHLSGAASYHLTPDITVGFGVSRESVTGLDHTGETNGEAVSIETFDYINSTYLAGIGFDVTDALAFGISYRYYDKQIYTVQGNGGAFGISASLKIKDTTLLANIKNMDTQVIHYSDGDDETLPTEYSLAARHHFELMDTLPTDLLGQVKFTQNLPSLKLAGLRLYPFKDFLTFGVGYQESRGLDSQVQGGMTFGVDLNLSGLTLSYAYQTTQYVQQNQEHHFSAFFGF